MEFKAILLFLALVACYATAVVDEHVDDGSFQFTVVQQSVHKDVLKAQQLKRLAKLGKAARSLPKYHQKLIDAPFVNDWILANVSFGQQGPFNLAFSTGAVRAWVVGEQVENVKSGVHVYYPDDSDTSKDLKKTFTQHDGSYTTTSEWYTDLMQFGKAKIKNQAFGVATKIDEENDNKFPVDGVFGLNHLIPDAYARSSNPEPTAPIDNLLRPLIKKTVSVYLAKQVSPSKGSSQGTVTVGGFDKTHCDGSSPSGTYYMTYQSSSDNRWVVSASNLQFGSYYSSVSGYAYFDTGVSTLQLPSTDLQQIYNVILPDYDWDTGLYTVDCKQSANLNAIAVSLSSGGYVQISPSSYVVDLGLDGNACALSLGIVGDDNSQEQYVFGTPLFREYCVAFDFENNALLTYYHTSS